MTEKFCDSDNVEFMSGLEDKTEMNFRDLYTSTRKRKNPPLRDFSYKQFMDNVRFVTGFETSMSVLSFLFSRLNLKCHSLCLDLVKVPPYVLSFKYIRGPSRSLQILSQTIFSNCSWSLPKGLLYCEPESGPPTYPQLTDSSSP